MSRLITLIATDSGRVQLSEAAARQSTKLAAKLDAQPRQRQLDVTKLTPKANQLSPSALQQLAAILEHFATTPYPTLAAKCPQAPSFDLVVGKWMAERLRQMPMQIFLQIQLASQELGCDRLMPTLNQYAGYRVYSVEQSMTAADRRDKAKLLAKVQDDSFVTP